MRSGWLLNTQALFLQSKQYEIEESYLFCLLGTQHFLKKTPIQGDHATSHWKEWFTWLATAEREPGKVTVKGPEQRGCLCPTVIHCLGLDTL